MERVFSQQQTLRSQGFSAVELLFSLAIIGSILYISFTLSNSLVSQTPAQIAAQQAYSYSQAVKRYITTHQNLLQEILAQNGKTNKAIVTVTTEVLKNEGFISNGLYDKNNLSQIPCTIIYWENNQLQSFIYYRDNHDAKHLDLKQLQSGLNAIGGILGLYQPDQSVIGSGSTWSLDAKFTNRMFISHGTVDPSQGVNPNAYYCKGSQIVSNSYVVNVSNLLALNNQLPKDDTIHQYIDPLHQEDDPLSNNQMNSDLNMDYVTNNNNHIKSDIVFQMNPNCHMDPNNLASMQDYDPNVDGHIQANQGQANSLGCRNKQLAIATKTDVNGLTMTITGCQQGGDTNNEQFVGSIKAASIQPTAKVQIGTPCKTSELGKMAQQAISNDPNDVNNLYISQVQCMLSPLCPISAGGYCYMPINNITIQIQTPQNEYSSTKVSCPSGTFIAAVDGELNANNLKPKACCGSDVGVGFCCHIDNCDKGNGSCSIVNYIDNLAGGNYQIFGSLTTTPSHWYQGCPAVHSGCNEGWGQVPDTYLIIRSITCTTDPSKAAIVIRQ